MRDIEGQVTERGHGAGSGMGADLLVVTLTWPSTTAVQWSIAACQVPCILGVAGRVGWLLSTPPTVPLAVQRQPNR